jgi:hypothetical protein
MTAKRTPHNKTEGPYDLTGEQWLRLGARERDRLVERAFRYWRGRGFPRFRLSKDEMLSQLQALARIEARDVIKGTCVFGPNIGVTLASSFHPQMWAVRVSRYKSPRDCFDDDSCLRGAIRRSLTVWPERHGANASCLRKMLKTYSNCAAVSNFKPAVARAIVQKYSSPGDVVVDFAAGYGGRLVGALTLDRHYLGIDPAPLQIRGLRRCLAAIQTLGIVPGVADIMEGCAEDLLPTLRSRSAGLVFSSPPYFDWEKYSQHKMQSFRRYRTYDDWIARFVGPIVEESRRILVKRGHLVVNVPNGQSRLPLLRDFSDLAARAGLSLHKRYRLQLIKAAHLYPPGGGLKYEALLVFRNV